MKPFARHAALMFLALRAGDLVSLAAGMWFVPRYVAPGDIGAVLPLASFATFLSLPLFAFAMAMMKESAVLAAVGERAQLRRLVRTVFASMAALAAVLVAVAAFAMPRFASAMGVSDASVGFLVVAAALLGCVAPVYTDVLQSLKRFGALAVAEVGGALARLAVLVLVMPVRALAGYFAGQAALPLFRIGASLLASRDVYAGSGPEVPPSAARSFPFARIVRPFILILVYQIVPMGVAVLEQSILRTALPATDSAGYYMASRFSDFLHYLSYPLILVMFPYTATAASGGRSVAPYVRSCVAATVVGALALAVVYALFGEGLMSLMPNGGGYLGYVRLMPLLVLATALTTCQVFATNAEVSAGRFGFLAWFVPLHAIYAAMLYLAVRAGVVATLDGLLLWFLAVSFLRFAFSHWTSRCS